MIIYFDETYDSSHEYLILAALFNPHSKYLHRRLLEEKVNAGFLNDDGSTKELKYTNVSNDYILGLAKKAIDIFFESTSWFRCIVINQSNIDLNYFGQSREPEKIKKARMYKKFAELLIAHNSDNIYNAVMLVDELTRCHGDEFIRVMKDIFCIPLRGHSSQSASPTLKDVIDIQSHLDQYHVNQINDILAGCVLNNLRPTKRRQKNELRQYLVSKLGVPDLLPSTWATYSKKYVEKYHPRFNIWNWKPG